MTESTRPDLKKALRTAPGLGAFWFSTGSPSLVELALAAEPEAVVIDLQHGLWDRATLEAVLGSIPAHVPTIARLADGTDTSIAAALDAGAAAVLIPLVETAEQAASCVAAARFPPNGRRSGGGVRPLVRGFADYLREAAGRTCVGVMIETVAGVAAAAAITAVPGLDFVFIGTGDLALSIGCFPTLDARHEAACRTVLDACRANDVPCGAFTTSAAAAALRRDQGYALVVVANDIDVVASGFRAAKGAYAAQAPGDGGAVAAFPNTAA